MLQDLLNKRFGDAPNVDEALNDHPDLQRIAGRGSCRSFRPDPVPNHLVATLAAVALSAPTKSDLQQRDIIHVTDPAIRARLDTATAGQGWIEQAPSLLVFCGNHRRQRTVHEMRGHAFANDHLDAFFNASVDAGVALASFVLAAEAAGLGCCPISAIRNAPNAVSEALGLPDLVFPVAGLAIGYPEDTAPVSLRLPLRSTFHQNRFDDTNAKADIAAYDARRASQQPYANQRYPERFGTSDTYTWSEDKARQYAEVERADFGAFIRDKAFRLD